MSHIVFAFWNLMIIIFFMMAVYAFPLPMSKYVCHDEGRWEDTEDCGAYIDCIPDSNGELIVHRGSCNGGVYNPVVMACFEADDTSSCQQLHSRLWKGTTVDEDYSYICKGVPNGFYCADCTTVVNCISEAAFPYTCQMPSRCDSREAFGGGVCYPERPGECLCHKRNRFQVDHYDDRKFFFCDDVMTDYTLYQCPSNMVFAEKEIQCKTRSGLPNCRSVGMGIFSYIPDCRTYFVCIFAIQGWVQKAFKCPVDPLLGELMFNEITGQCEDPCSWTAQKFSCQTEGRFGDLYLCNIYHECVAISTGFRHIKHECPLGFTWDPSTLLGHGLCVPAATNTRCPKKHTVNKCVVPDGRCPGVQVGISSSGVPPKESVHNVINPEALDIPSIIANILVSTEPPIPDPLQTVVPSENTATTTIPIETPTTAGSVGLPNPLSQGPLRVDEASPLCPHPFTLMADDCIMVTGENEKRTYSGAMEYCSGLGAGLASPTNLMALRNYVLLELGIINVRVGATRSPGSDGTWLWPDGRPVLASAWGPRQPDNAGNDEYCAMLNTNLLWDGPLNDFNCDGLFPFVCQYNL